jgi:hypothetical protein
MRGQRKIFLIALKKKKETKQGENLIKSRWIRSALAGAPFYIPYIYTHTHTEREKIGRERRLG